MSRLSRVGDHIVINLDEQNIYYDGQIIFSFKSTPILFSMLEYFCENPNIVLSKDQICSRIYGNQATENDPRPKSVVNRLRNIVSAEKYPELKMSIKTKASGYMYTGSSIIDTDKGDTPVQNNIYIYSKYQKRAIEKYEKIRLPFSDVDEERMLEDIYVCNQLGSSIESVNTRTLPAKSRGAANVLIENATLTDLCNYSKNVALIAIGGMGKTMMLQHLFLDSIKQYAVSGLFPVFVKLKDFSSGKNLVKDYIIKSVSLLDSSFTEDNARELLSSGRCQLLLDAADEIDQSDVKEFHTQLFELMDEYPDNQYVIASRECEMVRGLKNRFSRLYLRPFTGSQPEMLVNRLIPDNQDNDLRDGIIEFLNGEFIKRHSIFKTNPMMLTFVIMKFPITETFGGKKLLFYHSAYETMVKIHDREKEAYDRIYHSVHDSDEFTKVFREFCAITYLDQVHEFDYLSFEEYFNALTSVEKLENRKIMTKANFIHDACATACMMYEANCKYLYIDPGFQEFLFAEFNYTEDLERVKELSKKLWEVSPGSFEDFSAFDMFCEASIDKVEKTYYIPFLNEIFKGKTDDLAFISFLKYGYQELEYEVVNTDLVAQYLVKNKAEWVPLKSTIVEPANVMFTLLLRTNGIEGNLCFRVFQDELNYPEFEITGIFGEESYFPSEKKKKIIARRIIAREGDNYSDYEKTHNVDGFIRDDNDSLVCFGHGYKVDLEVVEQDPQKYQQLLGVLKTKDEDVWLAFLKIKKYYSEITKKHRHR